ncbi:uncharacterized protein KNAG_0L00780 [Huiozyma naganishii CBS 8797]|uniref:Integrase catalytic domain-containing protein n=1 Tax=Huiozyma naganishii (strain ATCC MYA-139 / BCRC 22969 / CBS 8797 / KCTC 17520 / NBRC 10181 / NCYC 3082 / Yp74L-3) TaxID=1071383 RepID=J7SAF1_HUIN7|nr:hypothetical protein KNAG_0L00780 [Kazachstania naganishii CBS 8797]CCK72699.1 hypothetical protein KNAG_0L00780 [Kazachstania naganishii CBS 8797]
MRVVQQFDRMMKRAPHLLEAAIHVTTASSSTQKHLLDKFGEQEAVNVAKIRDYIILHDFDNVNSPHSSSALVAKKKVTSTNPPSPCPECQGNHWRRHCPTLKRRHPDAKLQVPSAENDRFGMIACLAKEPTSSIQKEWIIDSGCDHHMASDLNAFTNITFQAKGSVHGVGAAVPVEGHGHAEVENGTVSNVDYVPSLPTNLISVSQMTKKNGAAIVFTADRVYAMNPTHLNLKAAKPIGLEVDGLYRYSNPSRRAFWSIDVSDTPGFQQPSPAPEEVVPGKQDLWHSRLGHPGTAMYQSMAKTLHLPVPSAKDTPVCPTCAIGKGKIHKGRHISSASTAPLQLIQTDLCGGFRYNECVDSKYFLTISDSYSRYYSAIPLKSKADATKALINWIIAQETFFDSRGGYKVCAVRTDNGGEFTNHVLHDFFAQRGIDHQLTVPHSSYQNGAVERAHRTLQERVRCLLLHGRVPPFLWSEALRCAVYLLNRSPVLHKRNLIPYQRWHTDAPRSMDLSHLQVFGCLAYATLPPVLRDGKLPPTSISGVMVGYDPDHRGYRIYHPATNKTYVSTQVQFDESQYPLANTSASAQAYDFATSAPHGLPAHPATSCSSVSPPGSTAPAPVQLPTFSTSAIPPSVSSSSATAESINTPDGSPRVSSSATAESPRPSNGSPRASSSSGTTRSSDSPSVASESSEPSDSTRSSDMSRVTSTFWGSPSSEHSEYVPSSPPTGSAASFSADAPSSPPASDTLMPDYVPTDTELILSSQERLQQGQTQLVQANARLTANQQQTLDLSQRANAALVTEVAQLRAELQSLAQQREQQLQLEAHREQQFQLEELTPHTLSEVNTPTVSSTSPIIETPGSSSQNVSRAARQALLPPTSSPSSPSSDTYSDIRLLGYDSTPAPQTGARDTIKRFRSPTPTKSSPTVSVTAPETCTTLVVGKTYYSSPSRPGKRTCLPQSKFSDAPPSSATKLLEASDSLHDGVVTDQYAVGNTPIPAYGLEGTMVPFGDTTEHHSFLLQGVCDENSTQENPVTTALAVQAYDGTLPKTFNQACNSPHKNEWYAACDREFWALYDTKTFELVDLPPNRRAIPTKWVFSVKDSGLFKARLVVQGFRQTAGIDYHETFAPVIRYESVRLFLAIAARYNMSIHQMDVVTAFLNSPIDTEIYVKQAPGFNLDETKVWKLNSALYGLKQSPLLWNEHIKSTLRNVGFIQHPAEFGLYYRMTGTRLCLLALYVDDLLIASPSDKEINKIKAYLSSVYRMKDLGHIQKFLGMNIKQSPGMISLSLHDYIEKKVRELGYKDLKPTHTPLQTHGRYEEASPKISNITEYQRLIGTLLFVANTGRPDVAFSVSYLSSFLKDPREVHLLGAKRVLAYLDSTKDQSIVYQNDNKSRFDIYTDASYADTPEAKSTYGYVLKYADGSVSWASRKIPCVVLSTTEAEYVAANESIKETIWLDEILKCLKIPKDAHNLYVDNESALESLKHPVFHSKTKHIRVRYHFIRENVKGNVVIPSYINTKKQQADICTKILARPDFDRLKALLYGTTPHS